MPPDLHQPRLARRSHLTVVSAISTILALAVLSIRGLDARAQDAQAGEARVDAAMPRGPTPCAIDGRASLPSLEITRRSRHGHTTVARVEVPPREVRVRVLSPSLFHVATRVGEPALEGHTHTRPPLSLRRDVLLGGVHVRRGAPIVRTTPREQSLDVDVDLGGGALLRRYVIGCDALRVREADGAQVAIAPSPHRPHWHVRAAEIAMRERAEEGLEAARISLPRDLVLEEVRRTEAFVHVRAHLPHARLDGWVRDNALTPEVNGAR